MNEKIAIITEEFLKFYADTPSEQNKLFTWKINSIFDLEARLMYWRKKYYVRAAWYVVKENGVVVSSQKIDLVLHLDYKTINFSSI